MRRAIGALRLSPASTALILANLMVFGMLVAHGASLWHGDNAVQLAWGANFSPATQDGEWWRIVSAMFLHFGIVHLTLNMIALWEGARLLEPLVGGTRLLAVYLCAGVGGNLLSLIVHGDGAVSGGASGAIFGIYGALVVLLLRNRGMHAGPHRLLLPIVAGFTVVAILLGLVIPGIDNAAHVGGLLAGTLTGAALFRHGQAAAARDRVWRFGAAILLFGAYAAMLVNLPPPRYLWSEELTARAEIGEFLVQDARLSTRWDWLVDRASRREMTFTELADSLERDVGAPYAESFEHLARVHLDADAPSAAMLERLRAYAAARHEAARHLAEVLRERESTPARDAATAGATPH